MTARVWLLVLSSFVAPVMAHAQITLSTLTGTTETPIATSYNFASIAPGATLDVSAGMLGAEKRRVQHLFSRRFEMPAAAPDLGPQFRLPVGSALEADVVIGPRLDYRPTCHRSLNLRPTLGQNGRHRLLGPIG